MVGQRENPGDGGVWGCVWTLITQVNEKEKREGAVPQAVVLNLTLLCGSPGTAGKCVFAQGHYRNKL